VTKLVTDKSAPTRLTAHKETDSRTALTRGLAEYISGVTVDAAGGRRIMFQRVFDNWAQPEESAKYPAAIVYSTAAGLYDASRFAPGVSGQHKLEDGSFIVQYADFVLDMTLEIWCNDPIERAELVGACEDALNPSLSMYGFVLELPHYFNERAVFELKSLQYLDNEEDVMRRYRRASFVVTGQVPFIRRAFLPMAKPRVDVVANPDFVLEVT